LDITAQGGVAIKYPAKQILGECARKDLPTRLESSVLLVSFVLEAPQIWQLVELSLDDIALRDQKTLAGIQSVLLGFTATKILLSRKNARVSLETIALVSNF
jgi:hypothetical protein